MSAVAAVACPVCQGEMWDETKSKYYDPSKNRPIAKCKNKACSGAVWPPKNGNGHAAPAPRAAAPARQPIALGDAGPFDENEGYPASAPVVDLTPSAYLYGRCLAKARTIALEAKLDTLNGDVSGAVVRIASTLFVQASRR